MSKTYSQSRGTGFLSTEAKAKRVMNYISVDSPVPLTLSTLKGHNSGLRNWYPMAGNRQRITLSIILSHSCGTFRVFFATPADNEPGGERLNQSIEGGAVGQNLIPLQPKEGSC